jgi:hypothetical protein
VNAQGAEAARFTRAARQTVLAASAMPLLVGRRGSSE